MLNTLAGISPWTWLLIAWAIWVVTAVVGILAQRRSPIATLAWVLGLVLLPYVGALVYLFFGPRRLQRRRLRYAIAQDRVAKSAAQLASTPAAAPFEGRKTQRQLAELIARSGEGRAARAERVMLFDEGDACYAAIEAAIARARHHVHMEYYIWEPGAAGAALRDALAARAAAGVQVRVLIDPLGSNRLPRGYWAPLEAAGGRVALFNPIGLSRLKPQLLNFRTHRKLVVCDGRVGFTGGMNISDRHSRTAAGDAAWRDTHLVVEGEPVRKLQRVFVEDWLFADGAERGAELFTPEYFPPVARGTGPWVQIAASGPDDDRAAIHRAYFAALTGARRRIWLTTPYFIPDEPILLALTTAAQRGVDVRVLVPKRGDSRLVAAAARTYFDDLVRAGAHVAEYGPPMLHAKTLVVDDDIAIVGTANIDNRSFRLNFELVAVLYDAPLTGELAAQFSLDLERASEWRRPSRQRLRRLGPLVDRFLDSLARLFSPIL
jgi:cardiolipin synthase